MEQLLTAKEVAERYRCSPDTARRYMRQMVHMEHPLMVTEKAVSEWEQSRTYYPAKAIRAKAVEMMRRRVSNG